MRSQGGLGIITALTQPTPEDLRAEIRKCRDLLDDPELPFGVNVTLLPALVPTDPEPILRVIIEEGVKVVELTIAVAGPSAGATLADYGADVIKGLLPASAFLLRS